MTGEVCERCCCVEEEGNVVVLHGKTLVCLACLELEDEYEGK